MRTLTRTLTGVLLAGAALVPAGAAHAAAITAHPIRNTANGLCLQPSHESTAPGTVVVQAACAGAGTESVAQSWQYVQVSGTHYRFVNQLSGLCLTSSATAVFQSPCSVVSTLNYNTGVPLPASARLESSAGTTDSGLCVTSPNALLNESVPMAKCAGTPAQTWSIGF